MADRLCYYIPPDQTPTEAGYRVAVVFENEDGYRWTGGDGKEPWYWGKTLAEAEKICDEQNEKRFGLSPKDAAILVLRSMTIKAKPSRKRKAK